MTLNTFAMTVEALHSTGLNIVRCPALGTRNVYLTDDFGNFQELHDIGAAGVSLHTSGEIH